jgi:hypothetical protein
LALNALSEQWHAANHQPYSLLHHACLTC